MGITERLNEVPELPTLPEVMARVQAAVDSDESGAKDVAGVLREDPALAAKILKVANSAFYGAPGRSITSLKLAITRIGYSEVRNITVAVSLIRRFSKKSNLLDYRTFWRHSLAGAFTVQAIGRLVDGEAASEHADRWFLVGLLHDIGILVYDQFFHDELLKVIEHRRAKKVDQVEAEAAVASGDTHGAVGGALLELWRIHSTVSAAVRYHHHPLNAPAELQVYALSASLMEHLLAGVTGAAFEGLATSADQVVWDRLGLVPDQHGEGLLQAAQSGKEKANLIGEGGAG